MKKSAFLIFFLFPLFSFAQQSASVLSTGQWYKIAVEQTGVHQITYTDLVNYGIDVGNLNPNRLAIYGNPAGMLSESLDAPFYSDLQQLAIAIVGEDDGSFDQEDYILFFGQASDTWKYDQEVHQFLHSTNLYTRKTHYFLTIGTENGKRVQAESGTVAEPTGIPMYYDYLIYHESELVNPGKSGKVWLGEELSNQDSVSFYFETQNTTAYRDTNYFQVSVATKSTVPSQIHVKINGDLFTSIEMPASSQPFQFYRLQTLDSICSAGGEDTRITFIFDQPNDSATAWINYFQLDMAMKKLLSEDQLSFRTQENIGPGEVTGFSMEYEQPEILTIWEVTDPMNVKDIMVDQEDDQVSWQLSTENLLKFHAFTGHSYFLPEFVGMVDNQNLHHVEIPRLVIVSHPDFLDQANDLKIFHEYNDEISTEVFTPEQVYNEFSSGSQDPTAIRNFIHYLLNIPGNSNNPKYLLLFGAASYDYLDRVEGNTNLVPTYQTYESTNQVHSFATDQYFGLRDAYGQKAAEVAVGRLAVTTMDEAEIVLEKINYYADSYYNLGSWRNEMLFIGDDGDNNLHLEQSEYLLDVVKANSPEMNLTQAHLDFYELVQTDEGPRYPEVNAMIEEKINEGVFYINYSGHGGPEQLADERIVSKDDLDNWTNQYHSPLWVIASSDVAHFDNPAEPSLAEDILLNEGGGGIALLSSSRPTFASSNLTFNAAIIEKITDTELQQGLRFGDLIIHAYAGTNDSKWVLLADPALRIFFPQYGVETTAVNDMAIEEFNDTISPGDVVQIKGQIVDKQSGDHQAAFNGTVYLKVYAPPYIRTTNGNQGGDEENVQVQDSLLNTGTATVSAGEFEIEVSMPSKYYEDYGQLKLSWYAENGETDANGYNNDLTFGGEPDGIDEANEMMADFRVYPTVFSQQLTVESKRQGQLPFNCALYNTSGLLVYKEEFNSNSGVEVLSLPFLSGGMYILRIYTETGSKYFKLFKQ